jgi:hypothetical protein
MTAAVRVFLSGPIDGLPLEVASSWRQRAAARFAEVGVDTYDPTRVISATAGHTAGPNEVFANDRWHLLRSDVMLVNLDLAESIATHDAPFFTIGEMFLGHAANLPIITVGKVFRGRPAYEAIVTRTFDELDAAVDYIIATYAWTRS